MEWRGAVVFVVAVAGLCTLCSVVRGMAWHGCTGGCFSVVLWFSSFIFVFCFLFFVFYEEIRADIFLLAGLTLTHSYLHHVRYVCAWR